jgi:pyruvate-formate lyase-activating enzyme
MTEQPGQLFSSVSISLTQKCNIACEHCMPESGPDKQRLLEAPRLLSWIAKLADYGTSYLAFTGGEPFIVPDLLAEGSASAARFGMTVSVMTNAFWARTLALGEDRLRRFPDIQRIGISTDRFHWKHVPLDYVRNAIDAGKNLGRTVMVRAAYTASAAEEVDEILRQLATHRSRLDAFEAQPVIQIGRAQARLKEREFFDMGAAAFGRCGVADTPTIDDQGSVFACCGPAMYMGRTGRLCLGNIDREDVATIAARARANVALQTVRTFGPGRLLRELEVRTGTPSPGPARHMCDLCKRCFAGSFSSEVFDGLDLDAELYAEVGKARLVQLGDISMLDDEP